MSDFSSRLGLPYLLPAQAQKHVTHNEALLILDALVQTGIAGFAATTPPATPDEGALYALGNAPSGQWAGQDGRLALYHDNAWVFFDPQPGWRAWDLSNSCLMVYEAGAWGKVTPDLTNIAGVGIATSWDTANRLAVAAESSLFSHAGEGHQVKINKATSADTSSLLFQTDWTGHAEMGLAGNDAFAIKLSTDGNSWIETLRFDQTTGTVSGAAVQDTPTDTTAGRLMRADWGYSPGTLLGAVSQSAGVPTGSVIERGSNSNGDYVRWADGTQICTRRLFIPGLDCNIGSGALFRSNLIGSYSFPATFASVDFVSATINGSDNAAIRNGALQARFGFFQDSTPDYWHGLVLFTTTSATSDPAQETAFTLLAIGRWF